MNYPPKSYYKILEVDAEATIEIIEVAYRRLAKRYHPDLNQNQDTTAKMQELNEAYDVLHNLEKRKIYDQYLAEQHAKNDQPSTSHSATDTNTRTGPTQKQQAHRDDVYSHYQTDEISMATTCEECGRTNSTLRFASFPYVFSIIFITFRRATSGLYCEECRQTKMNNAKIISALLGWWGFPWGIIYTLGALFTPTDGIIDAQLNADYLRWLGGYFIRTGYKREAKEAIQASLELNFDQNLANIARSIFGDDVITSKPHYQKNTTSTKYKSDVKSSSNKIVIGFIVVATLALIAVRLYNFGVENLANTTQDSSQPIPLNVRSLTITPTPNQQSLTQYAELALSKWAYYDSDQELSQIEYPETWHVVMDSDQIIVVEGEETGIVLMWWPNDSNWLVSDLLEDGKIIPDLEDDHKEFVQTYFNDINKEDNGEVERIDTTGIKQIGQYMTIYNDVTVKFTSSLGTVSREHVLLYMFDCGKNICYINFYKTGGEPFTVMHMQAAERIISSMKFRTENTEPSMTPTISELAFCKETEFNKLTRQCKQSHSLFTGKTERIFVSWTPISNINGPAFVKKWYFNEDFIFDSESANNYAYIEVDTRPSLKPGNYSVEVYIEDQLIQQGSFAIK